jgi:hypothetical protein
VFWKFGFGPSFGVIFDVELTIFGSGLGFLSAVDLTKKNEFEVSFL